MKRAALSLFAVALAIAPLIRVVAADETTSDVVLVPSYLSGNRLWDMCRKEHPRDRGCWGYVIGIADVMNLLQATGGGTLHGFSACIPRTVLDNQIVDVVVLFLHQHPAIRDITALELVNRALDAAFPCPPSR